MTDASELALILEGGKAAHENHSANLTRQIERIGLLEMSAMAAPAFAAAIGCAFAVIFYTANHSVIAAGTSEIVAILGWFFAAILLSVMVPGLSWLRQYTRTLGLARQKLNYEPPFVHSDGFSRVLLRSSIALKASAIFAIVASYSALAVGGLQFLDIIR
ncbi:MAG: hypothetical protein AAF724_13010 [Pseudomonadota bacterium]